MTRNHFGQGNVLNEKAPKQTKQEMRDEADRLIQQAIARKALTVTQGKTRLDVTCGKCGAANRVMASAGEARTSFTCKNCAHEQLTF
jgi:transposase-like protein